MAFIGITFPAEDEPAPILYQSVETLFGGKKANQTLNMEV